ncbi:hypothetical protein B6U90_04855 [Thermoplasmatales archaeon ex4484_6]|nr:MAG: hypothetical protein B6U90_04855 [Thermoplasmatales archaeon ex4484_6]
MHSRTVGILLASIMTMTALFALFSGGEKIDTFYDRGGPTEDLVVLKGTGNTIYDSHLYFEIERNVPVSSASMKISTENSAEGPWIRDPAIDVGSDNNVEWTFSGTGYGDFGRTTVFSDDTEMKTNTYHSGGTMTMGDIMLPSEASIINASMTVRGRFEANIGSMSTAATAGKISYTPQWIVVGDINGDGLNDSLVSTGKNGRLYKYIQDSSGAFEATRLSNPTTYNDYILYDVDSDDDYDIVYSSTNGIYWLSNDGSGNFGSSTTLTTDFTPEKLISADLDGDGEDEIVGAAYSWTWSSSSTVISYLKRNVSTTFDLWPLYETGSGSGSTTLIGIKAGDWNDDSYTDIYAAFTNRKVYTFQNPAYEWYYDDTSNITSKSRWSARNVLTSPYSIDGWDVGDVDGDGNADVAIAPNYYYNADIYYFRNRGTSSWNRYDVVSPYIYYPKDVAILDLDGDNDNDIFFSCGSYYYNTNVGWCVNSGNPNRNSWNTKILMSGHDSAGDTAFKGDINSDGYMDVGLFFTGNRQVIAWKNLVPHDGSKIAAGYIEDGGLVQLSDLEPVDMDGDGDDDYLITAFQSGTVGWYENDGTPFAGEWNFHRINGVMVAGAKEVAAGDIDNDGDLDVAVTAYSQSAVMWFENTGNPKGIWDYHYVGYMRWAFGCALGDMDEDGQLDILVSAGYYYSDGIRMYYTSDPDGSWNYRRISPSVSYCGAINITDMNQDGHLDVLVTVNGWSGQANIYRNPLPSNPRTATWTQITTVSSLQYPYEALPIDINEDGVLDVVASSNYGGIKWAEAPSNPNQINGWRTYTMDNSISYPWGLEVTDVDNDGYDDVFVSCHYWWASSYWSYGRGAYWLEETDDMYSSWQKRTLDSSMRETYGIAVSDHDGDGQPEIFVLSMFDDVFKYSKPVLNYPSDIRLDLAGDGVTDVLLSGSLRGNVQVDLTTQLQNVLDTRPTTARFYTDGSGNPMMSMPLDLYSASLGRLTGHSIDIRYNVTLDIDNNGALRDSITRIIPDYSDPVDDSLRIYIVFKGRSEGTARISDLSVEYNSPPKLIRNLPKDLKVNEDSIKKNAMDLTEYFKDDYDSSSMLNYEVVTTGPNKDKVGLHLENGANLTIDSRVDADFDRDVTFRIIVTDNGGPGGVPPRIYVSKDIEIDVLPVDDPPLRGNQTLPPRIYGYEGEETMAIDLSEYNLFTDPDDPMGVGIRYLVEINPDGMDPRDVSNISCRITSSGKLYIRSEGDWTGSGIPVRVWGYDGELIDRETDPYHMTLLDIININDPPEWKDVPDIIIDEDNGKEGALDLTPFVTDIDTDPKDLRFTLISHTNSTYYAVSLDPGDSSKVDLNPRIENWFGQVDALVEVSDGEYSALTTIHVKVNSVNDLPTISIKYPMEDSSLTVGPLSVMGEAYDVEGIDSIIISFMGERWEASGKVSWGETIEVPDGVVIDKITYNVPITVTLTDTDGEVVTETVHVTLIPKPIVPPNDPDGDGYPNYMDDFPFDPSEHKDSDRDGVGDNADKFPDNPELKYDSDNDGVADAVDEYPFDPENGRGVGVIKPPKEEKPNWFWPIFFIILAVILAIVAVLSILSYLAKRKASGDPRKAVEFYNKQEKRRELFNRISQREKIEGLLSKTHLKMEGGKGKAPTHVAPMTGGMPMRAGLPPPGAMGGTRAVPVRGQLPPPQPGYRMPPPPPRR